MKWRLIQKQNLYCREWQFTKQSNIVASKIKIIKKISEYKHVRNVPNKKWRSKCVPFITFCQHGRRYFILLSLFYLHASLLAEEFIRNSSERESFINVYLSFHKISGKEPSLCNYVSECVAEGWILKKLLKSFLIYEGFNLGIPAYPISEMPFFKNVKFSFFFKVMFVKDVAQFHLNSLGTM